MSISSTDHVVVPENEGTEDAVEVTFADLGLPEGVVRKLAQNGVTTPFPIQAATIPDGLVRLSVGIEDVDDLWDDLVKALDSLT